RFLDLLGEVLLHMHRWRNCAEHGRERRRDIVGDPGRGNALGWRSRVPQERLSLGRAKCVAEELIARPFADMSRGDVADIVEIEAEDAAKSGIASCVLGAVQ